MTTQPQEEEGTFLPFVQQTPPGCLCGQALCYQAVEWAVAVTLTRQRSGQSLSWRVARAGWSRVSSPPAVPPQCPRGEPRVSTGSCRGLRGEQGLGSCVSGDQLTFCRVFNGFILWKFLKNLSSYSLI